MQRNPIAAPMGRVGDRAAVLRTLIPRGGEAIPRGGEASVVAPR